MRPDQEETLPVLLKENESFVKMLQHEKIAVISPIPERERARSIETEIIFRKNQITKDGRI